MAVVLNGKSKQNQTVICDADMERLLSLSGDAVKLYLHILKYGSGVSRIAVCGRIALDDRRLSAAERELCTAGMVTETEEIQQKPNPLTSEPDYTAHEIADFKLRDPDFGAAAAETERVMGKMLTISDVRMLMKLYHYFGLSAECMIMLLTFAAERCAESGRRLTMATLKREAERWVSSGIDSPEQADAFIKSEQKILSLVAGIKQAIGKDTYASDERAEIRRWAELGCGAEVAKIAMEISKKRIFEVKISYMGKIIKSWKAQGLNTVNSIMEFEKQQKAVFDKRAAASARKNGGKLAKKRDGNLTEAELESLRQTEEFYKNGGGE